MRSLRHSLDIIAHSRSFKYDVQVMLNGGSDHLAAWKLVGRDALCHLFESPMVCSGELKHIPSTGKIHAVNQVIRGIPKGHGLIVVDDDIIVHPHAIQDIHSFLLGPKSRFEALCFTKTPMRYDFSRDNFSSNIHFLFHPSVQKLLLAAGIFQSGRGTGSLYALPASRVSEFPDPSNESDILSRRKCAISCYNALTWYPTAFEEEVRRRAAQVRTRLQCLAPYNMKTIESPDGPSVIDQLAKLRCPDSIRARLTTCILMMEDISKRAHNLNTPDHEY